MTAQPAASSPAVDRLLRRHGHPDVEPAGRLGRDAVARERGGQRAAAAGVDRRGLLRQRLAPRDPPTGPRPPAGPGRRPSRAPAAWRPCTRATVRSSPASTASRRSGPSHFDTERTRRPRSPALGERQRLDTRDRAEVVVLDQQDVGDAVQHRPQLARAAGVQRRAGRVLPARGDDHRPRARLQRRRAAPPAASRARRSPPAAARARAPARGRSPPSSRGPRPRPRRRRPDGRPAPAPRRRGRR